MDNDWENGTWPQEAENRMATLSHEFKSPLAVTLSALQLLEYKIRNESPEQYEKDYQQFFEIAKRNVYRTLRMANNFVDTGRLSAGCTPLVREAVDLCALLESTLRSTDSYAVSRGGKLLLRFEVQAPFIAMCDKQMIDRILLNLLSNALRHLPETEGLIEIILREDGENAVIAVKDNGSGIRPEDLPHVFERYWHPNTKTGVDRHGTGLGLYIVESLVQLHGGSVAVKSEPGLGAEFTFTIPRALGEASDALKGKAQEYQSDSQTLLTSIELSGIV